jgi:hypothetical protein
LSPGRLLRWIDADAFHAREINDHAAIADGTATDAVPTAAHSHTQVVEAPELDSSDHINAAHDQSRVFVDHPVLDPAGALVATLVRADQFATQTGLEGGESPGEGPGDGGTGGFVRLFCHETSSF